MRTLLLAVAVVLPELRALSQPFLAQPGQAPPSEAPAQTLSDVSDTVLAAKSRVAELFDRIGIDNDRLRQDFQGETTKVADLTNERDKLIATMAREKAKLVHEVTLFKQKMAHKLGELEASNRQLEEANMRLTSQSDRCSSELESEKTKTDHLVRKLKKMAATFNHQQMMVREVIEQQQQRVDEEVSNDVRDALRTADNSAGAPSLATDAPQQRLEAAPVAVAMPLMQPHEPPPSFDMSFSMPPAAIPEVPAFPRREELPQQSLQPVPMAIAKSPMQPFGEEPLHAFDMSLPLPKAQEPQQPLQSAPVAVARPMMQPLAEEPLHTMEVIPAMPHSSQETASVPNVQAPASAMESPQHLLHSQPTAVASPLSQPSRTAPPQSGAMHSSQPQDKVLERKGTQEPPTHPPASQATVLDRKQATELPPATIPVPAQISVPAGSTVRAAQKMTSPAASAVPPQTPVSAAVAKPTVHLEPAPAVAAVGEQKAHLPAASKLEASKRKATAPHARGSNATHAAPAARMVNTPAKQRAARALRRLSEKPAVKQAHASATPLHKAPVFHPLDAGEAEDEAELAKALGDAPAVEAEPSSTPVREARPEDDEQLKSLRSEVAKLEASVTPSDHGDEPGGEDNLDDLLKGV